MNENFSISRFITAGILHRPARNLAITVCFGLIAATIFSTQFLVAGTAGTIGEGVSRMGADLLVIPSQYALLLRGNQIGPVTAGTIIRVEPSSMRIATSYMDAIRNVPDVAMMSPQVYVASPSLPSLSASPVDIYGIDPITDFTITPWLTEPPVKSLGHGEIIVGSAISGEAASSIPLGAHTYTISGRLDPTESAVDHSVFMTLDDAYALAAEPGILTPDAPPIQPGAVNAILVKAATGADPSMVGARIQQPFPSTTLKVLERQATLKPASKAAQGLPALLNTISLVVVLAAFPLVALIAAMAAHERQRETGLLLAMGAPRRSIFAVILTESLVLALAGGIAGVALSAAAIFLIVGGGHIPVLQGFQLPALSGTMAIAATAIVIVVLVAGLASLVPAWQSSRMNPWEAIRDTR